MTQENFSQECSTTIFNLFANNSSIRRICEFYKIILLSAFFLFFSVLRLRSVKRECESRVLRMRGLRRSQARQRVNGRMMARVPTRENKSSSLGKSQGVVDEYFQFTTSVPGWNIRQSVVAGHRRGCIRYAPANNRKYPRQKERIIHR